MEGSTIKTAMLFQKYWSRSMIYFHGILAGFAFSHAAIVTAIMIHYNYDPKGFVEFYSCLSLKVHFTFYTLTTFCIVSCFDRLDLGHMNRKHWQIAWKTPVIWLILLSYITSLILTFCNQKIEVKFDYYSSGNETERLFLNTQESEEFQNNVAAWYHRIWVRDILALIAWLLISTTNFKDLLHIHLNNMMKHANNKQHDTVTEPLPRPNNTEYL